MNKEVVKHRKFSFLIGRWQPLHEGHIKMISQVLGEGKPVLIGIRDTGAPSKTDPFTVEERENMFREVFTDEYIAGDLQLIRIPDIAEVVYGRKVGYGIRQLSLDKETEKISGTKIRAKMGITDKDW